jgi:hypothetical protein
MNENRPNLAQVIVASLRIFAWGQVFLAAAAAGLALAPFAMVWVLGWLVSNNASFQLGIAWYIGLAVILFSLSWSQKLLPSDRSEANKKYFESTMRFGALMVLPIIMYFATTWGAAHAGSHAATFPYWSLLSWLAIFVSMHLDIVTAGLFGAVLPGFFAPPSEFLVSRLLFLVTRAIYTLAIVVFFGRALIKASSDPLSFELYRKRMFLRLAIGTGALLAFDLALVGTIALVSLIPSAWTPLLAVATPVLMQVLIMAVLMPAVHQAREAARRSMSLSNLKAIAVALAGYRVEHPRSPISQAHHSKLSWRVHLLPYLGLETLYRQFRLDEPWESPANQALIAQIPDVYRSPWNRDSALTTYLAVEVPSDGESMKSVDGDIGRQGSAVDVVDADPTIARPWTAPDDWQFSPDDPWHGLRVVSDRVLLVTRDGQAQSVDRRNTSDEELVAMIRGERA